jgi:formate dehydrogenase subunit gamma
MTTSDRISKMMRNIIAGLAAMIVVAVAQTHVYRNGPDRQSGRPDRSAGLGSPTARCGKPSARARRATSPFPDKNAATLIQSEGDNWRAIRNGPVSLYSAAAIFGMMFPAGAVLRAAEAASRSNMARPATPFRAFPASKGLLTG